MPASAIAITAIEPGMSLAQSVVPSERIDRDVAPSGPAVADLLADEEHRRLVALALADDDRAVDRQAVQLAAHRVDGGLVGRLLVAVAAQARGGDGGALGDADEFQSRDSAR